MTSERPRTRSLSIPRRVLGASGIEVTEIGIGCWAIGGLAFNLDLPMGWGGTSDASSLDGLKGALEMGANHFDTADAYGHGHSERLLGSAIAKLSRESLVIGSKVGYIRGAAPNAFHPVNMRHQLEASLRNIRTSYLDIYYLHNTNFGECDEYLDDATDSMHTFRDEGKIRAIGLRGPHEYALDRGQSRHGDKYKRFIQVAAKVQPDIIQVRYNCLTPTYDTGERDIFVWAEERRVGIVINKPLAQGLLLDKYDHTSPPRFLPGDHRNQKLWFEPAGLEALHRRLQLVKARFGPNQGDLARVALQYALHRSPNATVLAGFTSRDQVEMNLSAAGRPLSDEDVAFVRKAMAGVREEIGSFTR